jgi:hypothetical protein
MAFQNVSVTAPESAASVSVALAARVLLWSGVLHRFSSSKKPKPCQGGIEKNSSELNGACWQSFAKKLFKSDFLDSFALSRNMTTANARQ